MNLPQIDSIEGILAELFEGGRSGPYFSFDSSKKAYNERFRMICSSTIFKDFWIKNFLAINNNNSDNYILKDLRFKYQKCQIKNQNSRFYQSQQSYSYTCFKHSQMYVLKNVFLWINCNMIFLHPKKYAWLNVWIEATII